MELEHAGVFYWKGRINHWPLYIEEILFAISFYNNLLLFNANGAVKDMKGKLEN